MALGWFPGFHGGAEQTFHIEYKTNTSEWRVAKLIFAGLSTKKHFNATIRGLQSGTTYTFRIYSRNEYGRTSTSPITLGDTGFYPSGKPLFSLPKLMAHM